MSIPVTLESGNLAQLAEDREILTYSRLSGLRKVAILLRSLVLEDAAAAQALLDSLNSMEQVMVKEELDSMGVLEPDMVTDVLKEFDVELSNDVEVRVWDSNAELRYLVLPQRPAGAERRQPPPPRRIWKPSNLEP